MAETLDSKQYVVDRLLATKREGMEDLIADMEDLGFFEAPASGGNHLASKYGLVYHTRHVMEMAEKIGVCLLGGEEYNKLHDSVMIVAGLHDLGKAGAFGKPFYVPNMIQDGRPTKKDPEQKYKQSEKKPWERNKELAAIGHAERSVVMAMREIELTEDEWFAIRYHDGLYERANSELIGHETPLMMILHWADMWASRILETKTGSTEEKGE